MQSATNAAIPALSNQLMREYASRAEHEWQDFTQTMNGVTLLNSTEISRENAIKTAFIFGSIMGHLSGTVAFIEAGLNAHLIPNRRIAWDMAASLKMEPGDLLTSLLFISLGAGGLKIAGSEYYIYQGYAKCVAPHPEFSALDQDPKPVFYTELGGDGTARIVHNVVAWVSLEAIIRTFAN